MPFMQRSRKCKLIYMIETDKNFISSFLGPQGKERMDHYMKEILRVNGMLFTGKAKVIQQPE